MLLIGTPGYMGRLTSLGEEQPTVFPENFLFPTLTGACCPTINGEG